MPRLLEIAPQQYDALLSLGVPVWWDWVEEGDTEEEVALLMSKGVSCTLSSSEVGIEDNIFWTLVDG